MIEDKATDLRRAKVAGTPLEELTGEQGVGIATESGWIQPAEALDQLVASKTFSRSEQLKRLLIYLRDGVNSNDPAVWSETAIGTTVFGRKDFNPKLDTIVRVEMLRLRKKLDEFYAGEGAALPVRIRLAKNTYRPSLELNRPPLLEVEPLPAVPVEIPEAVAPVDVPDRYWRGIAVGVTASLLVLLLLGGAIWSWRRGPSAAVAEVAESPLWSGFQASNVVVAISTPLFFRHKDGFERSWKLSLPEDLGIAEQHLSHWPAYPQWNLLAAFDDVGGAVHLDHFLQSIGSTASIVPARQLSFGALAGKRTIVIGQPRNAPLLIDLLEKQNFRPGAHVPGKSFGGFDNVEPRAGELAHYPLTARTFAEQGDESTPDYALISSLRLSNGGEVLSVFGDRVQTGGYLLHELTDPVFVRQLNTLVFNRAKAGHQSAQIVFRVDYHRGVPTGLVYLAHRLRTPENSRN